MKHLKLYIEDALFATPANTMGMGGVNPNSGPDLMTAPPLKLLKKKNKKHHKRHIKESYDNLEVNGFCVLKPGFLEHKEDWLAMLKNNGWDIIQQEEKQIDLDTAKELYAVHKGKDFYNELCKYMSSDKALYCLCHKDCSDPIKDMEKIKEKVRKNWGIDEMKNAMHSSDSLDNVRKEMKVIF